MTAEVVVLNREAIAIAADSAVTLGKRDQKVYNSANKLFELSNAEPIAIVIYGASDFGVISWETVIKQYRKRLGATEFKDVDGYASNFIEYLDELVEHHPEDIQLGYAAQAIVFELDWAIDQLERERKRRKDLKQHFRSEEQTGHLVDRVTARCAKLEAQECLTPIDEAESEGLVDRLFPSWTDTVRGRFERIGGITIADNEARALKALARTALRSCSMDNDSASGLVVAGFGTTQLFPAWTSYGVDTIVAGKVRARHLERCEIGPKNPVNIRAFAQDDMVLTFLDGVHPKYPEALKGFVIQILDGFISELRTATDEAGITDQLEEYMNRVESARTTANDQFHGALEELLSSTHKRPTMSIVSVLPKEELAEFAETLVSLTSFKRRMTLSAETVGGPIDVAVISKGDGFVWTKRKHYFDKKFNLRYFERSRLHGDDISTQGESP